MLAAVHCAMAVEPASDGGPDVAQCRALGLSVCPQPFDAVLPSAADMLTWDQRTRVIGFRNTYRLYKVDVFRTLGAKAYPLPPAPYQMPRLRYQMDGQEYLLDDYLHRQSVAGLLVLKNGRIVYAGGSSTGAIGSL